jgi:Zn-dependent hydrolases, including glyoxylases
MFRCINRAGKASLAAAALLACAALGFAQGQRLGLQDLQIGSDKSPVEPYSIGLDKQFAPATLAYKTTVDSTNAKFIYITAKAYSFQDSISINGDKAYSGIPFKAALGLGDNKFEVAVVQGSKKTAYSVLVTQKDLSKEYKSELIQKGVWRIEDYAGFPSYEDMYLVEGKDKALLIDTGMGKGDLAGYAKSLTKLPIEVAVTHGHGDHVGQVDQFGAATVYMSDKDKAMLPSSLSTSNFKWIGEGDVIDLGGGVEFQVLSLAGHSNGSLLFLCPKYKILATGDAIGSGSYVWMFIPGTPALDAYRDNIQKVEDKLVGYDSLTFLVGHHWQERVPLIGTAGKQLMDDMRVVSDKLVKGEMTGVLSAASLGPNEVQFRKASYGLAGIWYSPTNMITK